VLLGIEQRHLSDFRMGPQYYCLNKSKRCADWAEDDLGGIIEHIRKAHGWHEKIIRPGRLGQRDNHGHVWWCFWCRKDGKDHRSFDEHQHFWNHLKDCHTFLFEDLRQEDEYRYFD